MKEVIAVISEYNPFHNGHKYQIDKIKEMYPESIIISIMSGSITQRGEFALLDKYTRAKAAVLCGVDCVFELPYPFCGSNAEVFAKAGVFLAICLGATHLCFGVETDGIDLVMKIADAVDERNEEDLKLIAKQDRSISYPKLIEQLCNKSIPNTSHLPNLILGVEYVRAIKKYNSVIIPVPIKRDGFNYNDMCVGERMSATAIRAYFMNNNTLISTPKELDALYNNVINEGYYTDETEIKNFLFRYVINLSVKAIEGCYDSPPGAGYFIHSKACESADFNEFFNNLTTKTYTYARLKRIVLYSLFDVEEVNSDPAYTTLLASSSRGREILKKMKKESPIPILTKPADYKFMGENAISQFKMSSKTDKIFTSFIKSGIAANDYIKKMPYIEKNSCP